MSSLRDHRDRLLRDRLADKQALAGRNSRLRVIEPDLKKLIAGFIEIRNGNMDVHEMPCYAAGVLRSIDTPVVCGMCGGEKTIDCNSSTCFGGQTRDGLDCLLCYGNGRLPCPECGGKGSI